MRLQHWILIVATVLINNITVKSQGINIEASSGLSYNQFGYMSGGHGGELNYGVNLPFDFQLSIGKAISKRSEVALQIRYANRINVGVEIADCNCTFDFESLNYNRFSFEYKFHILQNRTFQPFIGMNYGLHVASELSYGVGYYDSTAQYQYFFSNNPSNEFVLNRPSFQTLGIIAGMNYSINEWLYLIGSISIETTTGGNAQIIFMLYDAPSYSLNEALYHKGVSMRGSIGLGFHLNKI